MNRTRRSFGLRLLAALCACSIPGLVPTSEAAFDLEVELAAEIVPGPDGSNAVPLAVFQDKLYLRADDGVTGSELWVFDGVNPPAQVFDLNPVHDARPLDAIEFNGKLVFIAVGDPMDRDLFELWEWDGVAAAPVKLTRAGGGLLTPGLPRFTIFGGKLYFEARDGVSGLQVWEYDGSNAPVPITTINPPTGLRPFGLGTYFGVYDGSLYFVANNGLQGDELWRFDGTNPPTQLVDFNTAGNAFVGNPDYTEFQGLLYFFAKDADGLELRYFDGSVSDGSTFSLVADLNPGPGHARSLLVSGMTVFDGKLYFRADDGGAGEGLWVEDGTSSPAFLESLNSVQELRTVTTPYTSKLVFMGSDGSGLRLYSYDESDGRSEIGPLGLGFVEFQGRTYYGGTLEGPGRELLVIVDRDADDDGLPDATDPDTVAEAVRNLPPGVFDNRGEPLGQRNALLRRLADVQDALLDGDASGAIQQLESLRRHLDGCGAAADSNDWIIDCGAQLAIRERIDLLIMNLR